MTWLRRFRTVGADQRVVCFPYAGGTAKYYLPFAKRLADSEVFAVQYPGRQERRDEPVIDNVDELVGPIVDALLPLTDRPLTYFGHSMGATVAFEVARRLEAKGFPPEALWLSGRRAPSRPRDERTYLLSDDGLLTAVRMLAGAAATKPGFANFARMALPLIRADYKAVETYRYVPGPDVSCPITVLVGDDDPLVTVDEAASWRDHTTGSFELRVFPGGHFYLDAYQDDIADLISGSRREADLPKAG